MVAPAFFTLISTPSIAPSSVEVTCPPSATAPWARSEVAVTASDTAKTTASERRRVHRQHPPWAQPGAPAQMSPRYVVAILPERGGEVKPSDIPNSATLRATMAARPFGERDSPVRGRGETP